MTDDPRQSVLFADDAPPRGALRPLFRFNGGKTRLVPYVERGLRLALLRDVARSVYHEPFCGGAAVALALGWPRTVLSDASPHVAETYAAVRDDAAGVAGHLAVLEGLTPEDDAEATFPWRGRQVRGPVYHAARALHADGVRDPEARAALFLYLMARGYNGLLRVSTRTGALNVPCGDLVPRYPDLGELAAYARLAASWSVHHEDFAVTCARAGSGDAALLDPPYDGVFTQYTREGFSWADQERLADAAAQARDRGVAVVAFNADTERVRTLWRARGFSILPTAEENAITREGATRGRRRPSVVMASDLGLIGAGGGGGGGDGGAARAGRRAEARQLSLWGRGRRGRGGGLDSASGSMVGGG